MNFGQFHSPTPTIFSNYILILSILLILSKNFNGTSEMNMRMMGRAALTLAEIV